MLSSIEHLFTCLRITGTPLIVSDKIEFPIVGFSSSSPSTFRAETALLTTVLALHRKECKEGNNLLLLFIYFFLSNIQVFPS